MRAYEDESGVAPFRHPEAACMGVDPDLFFPETGDVRVAAEAKRVCAGCGCRQECLQYALEHPSPGIWGGLSERERRRLRSSMRPPGLRGPLPGTGRLPIDHGTAAGYGAHLRRGEKACALCARAWADARAWRQAQERQPTA